MIFTGSFWKQTAERAVKSGAQSLIGLWALDQFNILNADFELAGGVAAGAVALSILTSLVSAPMGQPASPSAVTVEPR